MIVDVMEDTPAARRRAARPGDIVVAFEGRPVTDTRTAPAPDRPRRRSTSDVRLTVLRGARGGAAMPVRLVAMPRPVAGERVAAEFGFVVREPEAPAGPAAAPRRPLPAVAFVLEGSRAEQGRARGG